MSTPEPAPTPPRTLADLLESASVVADRGIHLVDRRERETFLPWRGIAAAARRAGSALAGAGVRTGDRVALLHPSGEELLVGLFGAVAAGAVPVVLPPPARLGGTGDYPRRTATMLRAAGVRAVLAPRSAGRLLDEAVARAVPELGRLGLDLRIGDLGIGRGLHPETEPWEGAPGAGATRRDPGEGPPGATLPGPGPNDLALVQFSSGTTADPRPVALSHRAILAQVEILNGFWPEGDGVVHRGVSWLPLHHDMGLIGCVFPALERAGDLALLPPELFVARPAAWLRAISRHRATVSPAPNFAYGLCAERVRDEELEGVDLSSWRVALNGAEPVAAGTLRSFARRFRRWGFREEALTPVYGLAEAALAVTFSAVGRRFRSRRFERASLAPGCVPRAAGSEGRELVCLGPPVPGFRVEVRNPEPGAAAGPARPGAVGRVWIRGPSLMDGYLGRPAATARALRDGWLDTGDLGFLRGGELYLTGRAKDVVILRGRNFGPEEIEAAAAGAPGARPGGAVAVSRMPEDGHREELILLVEAARGASREVVRALPAAVRERIAAALDLPPDRVVLVPRGGLPRTSSGKLRRADTLRRWEAGELGEAAPEAPGEGTPR